MGGQNERFDLDDPDFPQALSDQVLGSGGFPYDKKMDKDAYETALFGLQKQLVVLQDHLIASGERVVLVFEGRDAAGKGGAIATYRENLNPRLAIIVALPKPSDRESTQWYFQRYVANMPAATETILFDRSWYNRAGVEKVMNFATSQQIENFLDQVPRFEKLLVDDGIHLFKFYLDIGKQMQMKRFHDRRHDPLKRWKLSGIDYEALKLWDSYSDARDTMLKRTSSAHAPWTVIRANDKRRARLAVIQTVLDTLSFSGKTSKEIGQIDRKIALGAADFLEHTHE